MGTCGRGLPLLQTSSRDPEAVALPQQPESSLKAQKASISPAIPWRVASMSNSFITRGMRPAGREFDTNSRPRGSLFPNTAANDDDDDSGNNSYHLQQSSHALPKPPWERMKATEPRGRVNTARLP